MPLDTLIAELQDLDRGLSHWEARLRAAWWCAAVLAAWWFFGLFDLFLRLSRAGRIAAWSVLVTAAGAGCGYVWRRAVRRRCAEGVAADVEKAFPELDNRLINHVQFVTARERDVFREAYLREGVPEWRGVDRRRMRDARRNRRAAAALAVAVLLVLAPAVWRGPSWTAALIRVLNPFSGRLPVSVTRLVRVEPGDTSVVKGQPVVLSCAVRGARGHRVVLQLKRADEAESRLDLGVIARSGEQTFSHRVAALDGDLAYRFLAGDSPARRWYRIHARAPLSFTEVDLTVEPPAYTRVLPRTFNALTDAVQIPQGADVRLRARCNGPVQGARLTVPDGTPLALGRTGTGEVWTVSLRLTGGDRLRLSASSATERAQAEIPYALLADEAPEIEVREPRSRVLLGPGGMPVIEFEVRDDYGLAEVRVERLQPGGADQAEPETVEVWPAGNARAFRQRWRAEALRPVGGRPVILRVAATDGYPFEVHRTESPSLVFEVVGAAEIAARQETELDGERDTLARLIEMQRDNLGRTRDLAETRDAAEAVGWGEAAGAQDEIRGLAGALLGRASGLLGGLEPAVRDLYENEMRDAADVLRRIPGVAPTRRPALAARGIALEERILRRLTSAGAAAERAARQRRAATLLALLEALVEGQTEVLSLTLDYVRVGADVGRTVVEKQDGLATDVREFVNACRRQAPTLATGDREFASLVVRVADNCESAEVRENMLRAAEELDRNRPGEAAPLEKQALTALQELQEMLDRWQVASAEEELDEILEALADARERLTRLRELEEKVLEAMKLTEIQADRSGEERDLLEEELAEIQKNIEEALLQIPRDLHIYPELTVANELVEDVFSVFEEVRQVAGSEDLTAEDAEEYGVLKPDELIEAMKRAEGRMDQMEMWLGEKPDSVKWNQEAYDREEMPKMSVGALETAVEDLIGDLLKESEALRAAADDSATNVGLPDMDVGWEVAEGSLESFGAQGKSGNQRPDHKEQSGRSNVGRQGQAIGETAAGSGTISEGDPNIEKRMTPEPLQSGQVQADGEADERATGGGKQASGAAEELGMAGAGANRRMDSTAQGSATGLESLLARAHAVHVKASLLNLRTDSLGAAAHHMRQASDAVAEGLPIAQVREHRRRAVASLQRARTELGGSAPVPVDEGGSGAALDDVMAGERDDAPPGYRGLVAEYFKSLNER